MPLHRDIYWVGRQWAVTGYGMQAIDQRLNGIFDIEVSRLWEDGLAERMYALKWLNIPDFDKGLTAARKRFPEPAEKTASPEAQVFPGTDGGFTEQPKPAAVAILDIQIKGWWPAKARFVSPWRVHRPR
jgi:hypothetical protein